MEGFSLVQVKWTGLVKISKTVMRLPAQRFRQPLLMNDLKNPKKGAENRGYGMITEEDIIVSYIIHIEPHCANFIMHLSERN